MGSPPRVSFDVPFPRGAPETSMSQRDEYPELQQSLERRRFLKTAAAGTIMVALGGGTYVLAAEDDPRGKQLRPDGRVRLPPGQRILDALKPMGGDPGDP